MASLPTGQFLNAQQIYKGLMAMGLTPDAAAGVAGNIYQESHGDPGASSPAGGGLFGETLANGGSVNGGSLSEQLSALGAYIRANGSVADINAHASSPSAAAAYFSSAYERPGNPQLQNRIAAANWVAQSAQSGNWGAGGGTQTATLTAATSPAGTGILGFPSQVTGFFSEASTLVTAMGWLVQPSSWLRIGAFIAGTALLLLSVHAFMTVGNDGPLLPRPPAVVPVPLP